MRGYLVFMLRVLSEEQLETLEAHLLEVILKAVDGFVRERLQQDIPDDALCEEASDGAGSRRC